MYISNSSACQQGSYSRPSWPEWDWIASDGLSQLYGPPMEQLRRLGHLPTLSLIPRKPIWACPGVAVMGLPAAGKGWPHAQHFSDPCLCHIIHVILSRSLGQAQIQGGEPDSTSWPEEQQHCIAKGIHCGGGSRSVSTLCSVMPCLQLHLLPPPSTCLLLQISTHAVPSAWGALSSISPDKIFQHSAQGHKTSLTTHPLRG